MEARRTQRPLRQRPVVLVVCVLCDLAGFFS
jgi:hypothetical protein